MADCDLGGTHGAACADSLHAVRLPTTKVWRAFPELDRFSDEQCARFAKAARRGAGRVWRWCSVGAVLAICWAAAALFMLWASARGPTVWDRFERRSGSVGLGVLLLFVSALVVFVLATAPAVLLRDRLLRRRILRIVRLRGRCFACKYNLLGLPVGAGLLVTCPECGETTTVDPALGELAQDDAGQARFQPRPDQFPEYRAFFTPARVRAIGRWSLRIGVFLFMLVGGLLIYHEFRIRADARRAAADRAGPDGLPAFVQRIADKAAGEKVNGWAVMMEAFEELKEVEKTVMARHAGLGADAAPDLSAITYAYVPSREEDRARLARKRALGLEALAEARRTGLCERLDRVRSVAYAARPMDPTSGPTAVAWDSPDTQRVRLLVYLCTARMKTAATAGERPEFERSLETALAMARLVRQQPFFMDKLKGDSWAAVGMGEARSAIMTHPTAELLDAVEHAYQRQPANDDPTDRYAGERLAVLDAVRYIYSDPSNVRWGWWSARWPMRSMLGGGPLSHARVPYYSTTVDQLEEAVAQITKRLATAGPSDFSPGIKRATTGNLFVDTFYGYALGSGRAGQNNIDFDRASFPVFIAIERYRLAHGSPPPSLAVLVPTLLAAIPNDPYSTLPLGYMLIDPATDEHGRCYLLFGAGFDGVQDLPTAANRDATIAKWPGQTAVGSHKDVVFNTPDY